MAVALRSHSTIQHARIGESAMTGRTAIVVLGMQRSGTSALTRALSLLGASLPRNLVARGLGNETGHWEPDAAIRLNDEILERAGSSVNDLDLPSDVQLEMLACAGFVDRLKDLITDEYADAVTFVVKDPRIALVFPLWEAALAELNVRCVVAIISRNPVEVALSMRKRQGLAGDAQPWPLERGGLTWLRYNLAAERHTRGSRRAFCEFSRLLDDWKSVARHLGDTLDVAWPISVAQAAPDIEAFLSRDLRHHRERDDFESDPGIWSEWIAPVFSQLQAAGKGHVPDQVILDAVRQSFEDLSGSLRHPASALSSVSRNANVSASVIDETPCSALAPLSDYLIGTELDRARLNRDLERVSARAALERQTARAIIAAGSDVLTGEVGRHVRSLQTALEERSRIASEAARYAKSLEETLAHTREANETAAEYARSLERSRAELETYAKTIEAELRNIRTAGNR